MNTSQDCLAAEEARPYPKFHRDYPHSFAVSDEYRASLPDLQNGPLEARLGGGVSIQHVGISNFRMPLRFKKRDGTEITLETSVTGTVSLDAEKRGINMSRIIRAFYEQAEDTFGFDALRLAVGRYKRVLESLDARIGLRFEYPMLVASLRSGLAGHQYYSAGLELVETAGRTLQLIHLDYVYSSTCPCSLELSEHARSARNQLATPHSQRSVARASLLVRENAEPLWIEDVIDLMRRAIPTETQVMVKREDEQAFAELNAVNPIFVEDAVRLIAAQFEAEDRIADFRVVASHQESLHNHDAVALLVGGGGFFPESIDFRLLPSLFHVG